MRLSLLGGSYTSRSIIANAQRCVNYFPENNPKDSPVPVTHYQRPGFSPLAQGPNEPVWGLFRASNGAGYAVIGNGVYLITPNWTLSHLGDLSGTAVPVSFSDNGIDSGNEGIFVNNTDMGWSLNLTTNVLAPIVDASGTFVGATRVDFIDTFILFNFPNTNKFGSTHSNVLEFDPLYVAQKTDYPDRIASLIVNRHQVLLLGQLKSEVWYDAGNPLFPFAELPGAYIEEGVAAPWSVAANDISVFWLGQSLQGQGVVWRFRGYQASRISNHALEYALRVMARTSTIADAIGYTYQQDGHFFYVLTFPSGDQTWVFDESTDQWHQRAWTDSNGVLHRDRSNCHAFINGKNVVGDWQNGTIYELDLDSYTDEVGGLVGPITCIRAFPHIAQGRNAMGQPVDWDGRRMAHRQFKADIECGNAPGTVDGQPAQIGLRWSDSRGKTWGNTVLQSTGQEGEFLTDPQWRGLGIARDRIYELSHSIAGPAALNGAWVDVEVLES